MKKIIILIFVVVFFLKNQNTITEEKRTEIKNEDTLVNNDIKKFEIGRYYDIYKTYKERQEFYNSTTTAEAPNRKIKKRINQDQIIQIKETSKTTRTRILIPTSTKDIYAEGENGLDDMYNNYE